MIKDYGKCGKTCEICMYYDRVCKGCLIENEKHPDIYNCIIFDCATDKNVQSCLSCPDNPCDLLKGLSKAYCPIHSKNFLPDFEKKIKS